MKAKAANWIKYNGVWHGPGEAFEINKADAEELKRIAEVTEDAKPEAEPEEPAKRGRKRKEENV